MEVRIGYGIGIRIQSWGSSIQGPIRHFWASTKKDAARKMLAYVACSSGFGGEAYVFRV